jgi:ABC-2 type transport system ATP-binding protein
MPVSTATEPVVAHVPVVASAQARTDTAIKIEHLSKTYPVPLARFKQFLRRKSGQGPTEALHDVSFEVRAGEVFGLIGRNGAGKTTLAKIVATLVQPTSGMVTVNSLDSVRDEERVRAQVGLASAEERTFYWRLTVEQNLLFFARLHGLRDVSARTRIQELLERFELTPLARKRFGELSTGNKQRMTVARALLNQPPILLLDEPTRSLDPLAAAQMRALISQLAADEHVTVLLTSHNLTEVEELCARIAIISRGRIRAVGTPASLRTMHRQTERITLVMRGLTRGNAEQLLAREVEQLSVALLDGALHVSFTREADDARFDRALRVLLAAGAQVVSCAVERATLLDVLERYESEPEATQTGDALKQGVRA